MRLFGGDFQDKLGVWAMRPQADMSGRLGGITCKSSQEFNERNLRFRPEWGNHKSAWGNAPGTKSKNTPSPTGAAQIHDRRTNDMINSNCFALSGKIIPMDLLPRALPWADM